MVVEGHAQIACYGAGFFELIGGFGNGVFGSVEAVESEVFVEAIQDRVHGVSRGWS